MELTQEERARITDSTHKIQSANHSLAQVDPKRSPISMASRSALKMQTRL